MPQMWIIAGCNGAGKTTLTRKHLAVRGTPLPPDAIWINPDETTADLQRLYEDLSSNGANYAAAAVSERRVLDNIEQERSFLIETVLSSDKYLKIVDDAKRAGFTVHMVYVTLETYQLAIYRVAQRVQDQGHDVAENKIRDRWARSMCQLMRFIPVLDELKVFDNSADQSLREGGEEAPLVMSKDPDGNLRLLRDDLLPALQAVIGIAEASGNDGLDAAMTQFMAFPNLAETLSVLTASPGAGVYPPSG